MPEATTEKKVTIADAIRALEPEDQLEAIGAIRRACYHLAECWDELGRAERLIAGSIEEEDIASLTGDVREPEEAFKFTAEHVLEGLGIGS